MRKKIVIILPILLILSTGFLFRELSLRFGKNWATIIGFAFYQVIWCFTIPLIILGKKDIVNLFIEKDKLFQNKNILYIFLIALTLVGSTGIFFSYLSKYSLTIFFIGVPFATINGICEEILWRGVFIRIFKNDIILSTLYPTIMFSIWHVSPQLVNLDININEILPFVLLTLPLGLVYSAVVFRTKSIKWVSIAHSLSGIFSFGIPLSTSLASITGIPLI